MAEATTGSADPSADLGRYRQRHDWRVILPDPRKLWVTFRRHLLPFLVAFTVVVASVALWTITRTPRYHATASLLVRPTAEEIVNVRSVSPDIPATSDIVNTQVRLMQSPVVASRVARAFARLHPGDALVRSTDPDTLARTLSDETQITRSASTYVIEVEVESASPAQAAAVANLFVTEFVDADRKAKVDANSIADGWLRRRTTELARNATAADAALQAYRISNGLISSEGSTLSEQEISAFNQQISQAQAELAEKQGRVAAARRQLEHGGGGADIGSAVGSGTIGTLRASEAAAAAKVAQLEARYGPLHPDLVKARSELAEQRRTIQLEIDRIVSSLRGEAQVAAARLSSLEASRGRSTSVLSANNGAQVGLAALQRRADAAKAIYETFLNRSRETAAQQGLQHASTQVASLAGVPDEPFSPNRRLAAVLGLVGGLLAGLVAVAAAEFASGNVRTREDVEDRIGLRYAGAIPTLASTLDGRAATEPPHDYIVSHPFSAFAESFRSLRAFLLLGAGTAPTASRALAITSALPREGKTTTALCLARASAMSGTPTVLVDADLRRRGSSEAFGSVMTDGLYRYVAGASLDEALVRDEATGLFVLGSSAPQPDAQDPLTAENVARLIADLRSRFRTVVVDTAPLLGVADARIVAASVDRVLLVTRWQSTTISATQAAIDLLLEAGAKVSGLALSQVDARRFAGTGMADAYHYRREFRSYYAN